MKFQFTQFSLFVFMSVMYVVVCLTYMLIYKSKLEIRFLVSYLLFAIYVMAIPLIGGGPVTPIMGFLLNYTSIFFAVLFVNDKKLFERYTRIYALGLLLSSIVRLISFIIPNLNQYFLTMSGVYTLIVDGTLNIRFAGVDIDPNYYAVQILIAISCLLVCIYYEKERKNTSIILCISLSILGFLSLSKMYLLVFLFLVIITLVCFFKNNIKVGMKFLFSIFVCGGVLAHHYFDYFYNSYILRFGGVDAGISDLTTGRSKIWLMFLSKITNNKKNLLLGADYEIGYLKDTVAHNMYLTALNYMGIFGVIITLIYFYNIRNMLVIKIKDKKYFKLISVNSIPLYVLLIANLALDSFVMDYFTIHLFLVFFALSCNSKSKFPMTKNA
ncbi:hypothetical protein [Clostridium sediminicola]|uniref:hypothetical protein n=1 Tax=Clostridium sediminicola TaxID=3114879 RepID=UPI003D16F46E